MIGTEKPTSLSAYVCCVLGGGVMISDVDILRAAHLMMHRYGGDAELEAAKYADLMRGCGDRDGLLAWARIWRMIAVMHPTPTGLPH